MHFAAGLKFFSFFQKSSGNVHVLLRETRANFYLRLLSKQEKKSARTENLNEKPFGSSEYFLVVNSEGAWDRCKNLPQRDISWIQTPES